MSAPDFFELAPRVVTFDPLAQLLGADSDGRLEYRYADAVKLAGHSCPTVAGAYLLAVKGLAALYPDRLPERGAIKVAFREDRTQGTTGVVASVFRLITGAAEDDGFQGLAGRFDRRELLSFNAPIDGEVRLSASLRSVELRFNADAVPFSPDAKRAIDAGFRASAGPETRQAFAAAFQDRVKRILVDHRDDPALVDVQRV